MSDLKRNMLPRQKLRSFALSALIDDEQFDLAQIDAVRPTDSGSNAREFHGRPTVSNQSRQLAFERYDTMSQRMFDLR